MPDFSLYSNYNKEANFSLIRFGADAPLLETELNEMQEIQRQKIKEVVKRALPNSILEGDLTYANGTFTIKDAVITVDGEIVYIPSAQLSAVNGDSIYLKVWEKEVNRNSILKKYGYEKGATIPNKMFDARIGEETSRRLVVVYDLVKTQPTSESYLKLGDVVNGSFVQVAPEIVDYSSFLTKSEFNSMFVPIT